MVVLNDVAFPPALANGALQRFVERGGGLLVVLGEHSTWPASEAALLPGTLGAIVDPPGGRSGSLGFLDYSHPIFEVFKAPRSGDFSGAHIFRYRALDASAPAPTRASSRDSTMAPWRRRKNGRHRTRHRVDLDAGRLVDRSARSSRCFCR